MLLRLLRPGSRALTLISPAGAALALLAAVCAAVALLAAPLAAVLVVALFIALALLARLVRGGLLIALLLSTAAAALLSALAPDMSCAARPGLALLRRRLCGLLGVVVGGRGLLPGLLRLALAHLQHVGRGLAVLRASAGHCGDLVAVVGLDDRLTVAVELDLDGAAQQVHLYHRAVTCGSLHERAVLGHGLHQGLIGLLLIAQAAHEPSAGAGYFGRVERQSLGLRHLGADGLELRQELIAAERTSAHAYAAEHLGLVAHAYLAQLYAAAEHAG